MSLSSSPLLCVVLACYLGQSNHGLILSWACGVILFTLLAGSPPFWHRRQILMLRMIMEGQYQFSSPEWDDRSNTVKDLVSSGHERESLGKTESGLSCCKVSLDLKAATGES